MVLLDHIKHEYKHSTVTDAAVIYLKRELDIRRRYRVSSSANKVGLVFCINGIGSKRTVNLRNIEYSCSEFQVRRLHCRYVIYFCQEQRLDPEVYIDRVNSIRNDRETYQYNFLSIVIEALRSDPICIIPKWIRLPGRPAVARKRIKGEARELRCSNCK